MTCRCDDMEFDWIGDPISVYCPKHDAPDWRRRLLIAQMNRIERRQRERDAREFGYRDFGGES